MSLAVLTGAFHLSHAPGGPVPSQPPAPEDAAAIRGGRVGVGCSWRGPHTPGHVTLVLGPRLFANKLGFSALCQQAGILRAASPSA